MNDTSLSARAAELFPDSLHNQEAWVRSVAYLRSTSSVGYAIDKKVHISKESSVLRGYVAPEHRMPEMKTVVSLPDEQVIPLGNVRSIREA